MAGAQLDFVGIGQAFARAYYQAFDNDRNSIINFFKDQSMLTFEAKNFMGKQQIFEKLASLPAGGTRREFRQVDCQPSGCGGILVQVVGEVIVPGESNALKFSELFHLIPEDANNQNFWVHNDIFRFNYG